MIAYAFLRNVNIEPTTTFFDLLAPIDCDGANQNALQLELILEAIVNHMPERTRILNSIKLRVAYRQAPWSLRCLTPMSRALDALSPKLKEQLDKYMALPYKQYPFLSCYDSRRIGKIVDLRNVVWFDPVTSSMLTYNKNAIDAFFFTLPATTEYIDGRK